MKSPTKKQMQFVIDNLRTIEGQANKENALNMAEGYVYSNDPVNRHECGTVHCVAGWYAVALKDVDYIKHRISKGHCRYEHGGNLMASHLGFKCMSDLTQWADHNRMVWGNPYGRDMFRSGIAYVKEWDLNFSADFYSTNPMSTVIQHLECVMGRLPD